MSMLALSACIVAALSILISLFTFHYAIKTRHLNKQTKDNQTAIRDLVANRSTPTLPRPGGDAK